MSGSDGDPPNNNPIEELMEQQLEQCKKEHEEEKTKLKRELENVNKEKDSLEKLISQENQSTKKSSSELIVELMESMKEESKEKDARMKNLEDEVKLFSFKWNANEAKVKDNSIRIEKLEISRNRLYIGQLCANVQEDIFGYVLPDYFDQGTNYRQPHVKNIETNINELCGTTDKKQEARRKWRKLQREIGWDPDLVDVIEGLMKERNKEAHPYPLDDDELEKIANELPGEKQQIVKKIIQISKKLKPLCTIY